MKRGELHLKKRRKGVAGEQEKQGSRETVKQGETKTAKLRFTHYESRITLYESRFWLTLMGF